MEEKDRERLNSSTKIAERPGIIIFSGPPCSGKSTLARNWALRLDAPHLQMDVIRSYLIPGSKHDQRDRDIAYRAMHLLAEHLLARRVTAIVDATYGRSEQRQQLELLARRTQARAFLVQCKVPPHVAVIRFNLGRKDHPAHDLTPLRVKEFNETFPYFEKGLTVDTTREQAACLTEIEEYVHRCAPMQLNGAWPAGGLRPAADHSR